MISILKHDVRKHIGVHLLLVVIILVLFSVVERQGTSDSYEIFFLRMLTEHYLLIFCMIPIFLLSILRNLEEDTSLLIVRCRNFTRYFFTKWLAISIYAILFVLLHVIIVALIGVGLPHGNVFHVDNSAENELFHYFEPVFSTPALTTVYSCLYMMLGLSFVAITMLTIFHFFKRRVVTIIVLFAYVSMVLVLKIPALGSLPFITLNRFIILHHNLTKEDGVLWSGVTMSVLCLLQVICVRYAWYRIFTLSWNVSRKGLFDYYAKVLWTRKILLLLCGIIGILTLWKAMNAPSEPMQDYIFRFFYGQEIGNFHLLTFLEQLIYYGTPLYLFAVFIENWSSQNHLPVFIRIKRKSKWLFAIILNGFIFQLFYISLTFSFLLIFGVLTNKSWTSHIILLPENFDTRVWLLFLCLKILELSVLFLMFFLLFIFFKNVTLSFLIVMFTHAINIVPNEMFSYNPAGLGTFARLQFYDDSIGIPFSEAFIIIMLTFILLLSIISYSYKRFFN